jgi:ribosomal protein S18 acetylase RimI-like enzyme
METGIRITNAAFTDLEDILSLQKSAYISEADIYDDYSIPPLHQTLELIRKEFENTCFLKALNPDNQIIGSIRLTINDDTGYIGKLIVDNAYRNIGLGRKLLGAIEQMHYDKVSKFELFTGHKSERNLHIYLTSGYKEIKRQVVNYNLTLVYLEKVLC